MFRLSAQDNGLYFFRDRADVRRCSVCNMLLDKWNEDLAAVDIPRAPKHDLSCSYDGVWVSTRRFKDAVEKAGIAGLAFRPVQRGLFAVRPTAAVAFDASRRGTRFEGQCETCGQYESVIGATPVLLMPGVTLAARSFARTDLEFGSGDEKTPLVLCSDDAALELQKARLQRVDLAPTGEG